MLASPAFRPVLDAYVREKMRAAAADRKSFEAQGEGALADLAQTWERFYASCLAEFTDRLGCDLPGAFRRLQDGGQVEVIAGPATHPYLPLLALDTSIDAQISQGVATYRRYFGRAPDGMWLPECAYRPARPASGGRSYAPARRGLEAFLADHGIGYFFLDGAHAADQPAGGASAAAGGQALPAPPAGVYGQGYYNAAARRARGAAGPASDGGCLDIYSVYKTGAAGAEVPFFIRDTETSGQVWSSAGYPGDPGYMEFHKKRDPGGLRYWRVTDRHSDLGGKMVYEPEKAAAHVGEHAAHFARLVEGKLRAYRKRTGRTGVLTLLFDAELFGHWWFEGIGWLGALVSALDANYVTIERASTALASVNPRGAVSLPEGSWGEGGRHFLWYNKETVWMWRRLYRMEQEMGRAVKGAGGGATAKRLLRQMARELFLAQSSDWQFLISTRSAADYGEARFLGHYNAWTELYAMLGRLRASGALKDAEKRALRAIEEKDALFDDVRPEWFEERTPDGL
jgi:1,4-alpha-glucan branching enzyme